MNSSTVTNTAVDEGISDITVAILKSSAQLLAMENAQRDAAAGVCPAGTSTSNENSKRGQ